MHNDGRSAPKGGTSWIERVADSVLEAVLQSRQAVGTIVCASGISPSGPVHLGNLREVMTVHLVADELRRRGHSVEHIHSWDDFDRLRKVPEGMPRILEPEVGRPLARIPDPFGEYPSYADRFIAEFSDSLERLAIRPRYVRQSEAYRRGAYTEQIRLALARRKEIFDILAEFKTPGRSARGEVSGREGYYPFRPYCKTCGRDTTLVLQHDMPGDALSYSCSSCGHAHTMLLTELPLEGKLVWKVDWPMRWAHEQVDFEPGGEDHSSPQGSFAVGKRIVREIFGAKEPFYVGYAFVGLSGASTKMSSSAGVVASPATALQVLEPAIVRWLYARRPPSHSFSIELGATVQRLYDEWDQLLDRVEHDSANDADRLLADVATRAFGEVVPTTQLRAAFRMLASAADLTRGDRDQIVRIASAHVQAGHEGGVRAAMLEPRLQCAINWALHFVPEEERTHVRDTYDVPTWAALSESTRQGVRMLLARMDEHWSLDGLTQLLYGIPKLLHGLPEDARPNDPVIKEAQRDFFVALYRLLCNSERGPRLPTLFLSLGPVRVRALLSIPAVADEPQPTESATL